MRVIDDRDCLDHLRGTEARIRFLSLEPAAGAARKLDLGGIHWVIVGGESGPGARPMQAAWVTDVRTNAHELASRSFFKQWGGANKKKNGRLLRDRTWDVMPWHLDDPVCS